MIQEDGVIVRNIKTATQEKILISDIVTYFNGKV